MSTQTNNTKHTPGPWTVSVVNQPMGNHPTNRQCLYRIKEEGIVSFDYWNEANAALIAAAPDLLEAAWKAVEAFTYLDSMTELELKAVHALQAAIDKAEGRHE